MVRNEVYGLQSWGRMSVVSLRRVAQCFVAWIKLRPKMARFLMDANRAVPLLLDIEPVQPQKDVPEVGFRV